ncbi:MAG: multicopper oxidase domain-containing protein [Acidobacteriota bacterium]
MSVRRLFLVMGVTGVLCACAGDQPPTPADAPTDPVRLIAQLSTASPPSLNVFAPGEIPCEERPYEQPFLEEPARILPVDGVMTTELYVDLKPRCVPFFVAETDEDGNATGSWKYRTQMLRTYGFPSDHAEPPTVEQIRADVHDESMVWSAPGPTFVLHKASAPGENDGTKLKFALHNILDPEADPHRCDELQKRDDPNFGGTFRPTTEPNCFHGNNSTNFHFHGSHVSPQEHQDYVGLELLPYGADEPEHAVHTRGTTAVGKYSYDFDRLRYSQAEGTHWYHAHKHGSTALQVLNGLIGSALIYGDFDRELEALFEDQGGLVERLLVVQQLQDLPPGMGGEPAPPEPLVNGFADPIVRMKPGEIQRWRFVGATMQVSAQLTIGFPESVEHPEVRQIAMDGVQFAPENYECQPILRGPDCVDDTGDDSWTEFGDFKLDPGSRIDVLIKAPSTPGRYSLHFEMAASGLPDEVMAEIQAFTEALAASQDQSKPSLLTLLVEDGSPLDTPFPTTEQFPKMPEFLADLEPTNSDNPRVVSYQMANRGNLYDTEEEGPSVYFAINDKQYDPSCVNETMVLGDVEEWKLTNNSSIAHPFHIHTNPFQMRRKLVWDREQKPQEIFYRAPYVWRDTVAIPIANVTRQETSDTERGEMSIVYAARDFTGEFVNHCHILGHEDRGMMHNVQVTCPNGLWGKPTSNLSPECVEGNYREAAPKCEP